MGLTGFRDARPKPIPHSWSRADEAGVSGGGVYTVVGELFELRGLVIGMAVDAEFVGEDDDDIAR